MLSLWRIPSLIFACILTMFILQMNIGRNDAYDQVGWLLLENNNTGMLEAFQPDTHTTRTIAPNHVMYSPRWSPDGKWLLYGSGRLEYYRTSWDRRVVHENLLARHAPSYMGGIIQRELLETPQVSPDEKLMLKSAWGYDNAQVWLMGTDGELLKELDLNSRYPDLAPIYLSDRMAWSSDSQWVYTVLLHSADGSVIVRMRPDGQDLEIIASIPIHSGSPPDHWDSTLSITSTGDYLLLRTLGTPELMVLNLHDYTTRIISLASAYWQIDEINNVLWLIVYDNVSRDYVTLDLDEPQPKPVEIYSIPNEHLIYVMNWSLDTPHNNYIIFKDEQNLQSHHLLTNVDVTLPIKVDLLCKDPVWTADGQWLIYGNNNANGDCQIFRTAPDGTQNKFLYTKLEDDFFYIPDYPDWLLINHKRGYAGENSLLNIKTSELIRLPNGANLQVWRIIDLPKQTIHYIHLSLLIVGIVVINLLIKIRSFKTRKLTPSVNLRILE